MLVPWWPTVAHGGPCGSHPPHTQEFASTNMETPRNRLRPECARPRPVAPQPWRRRSTATSIFKNAWQTRALLQTLPPCPLGTWTLGVSLDAWILVLGIWSFGSPQTQDPIPPVSAYVKERPQNSFNPAIQPSSYPAIQPSSHPPAPASHAPLNHISQND